MELLTLEKAAEACGLSPSSLYAYAREGYFRIFAETGVGKYLFRESGRPLTLKQFLAIIEKRPKPGPKPKTELEE